MGAIQKYGLCIAATRSWNVDVFALSPYLIFGQNFLVTLM
jgi:hypothetical protein